MNYKVLHYALFCNLLSLLLSRQYPVPEHLQFLFSKKVTSARRSNKDKRVLTLRLLMSYIYIYIYIYIYMERIFLMFLDHTRCSTVGRTPLDEWSARRRDLYLTTHDTHNRQISVPPVGFEPKISAGERLCCPLALLGANHFLHVSRIKVKSLTVRVLMSYIYIYGAPILDVSRSHTTTHHSR